MRIAIAASHILCPVGRGTAQTWASVRAGIARIGSSHVMDRHFDPIQMGLVPEDTLPPLAPEIDRLPLPSRARRILRLATPALNGLERDPSTPLKLMLGMPHLSATEAPWLQHVPRYLEILSGTPIDVEHSQVFAEGRSAALLALEAALQALEADETPVIVGGVDSFLDLKLLSALDAEGRILGPRVMDGFIPGEGAAFLLLQRHDGSPGSTTIDGVASTLDPGHRYGNAPARGEGLAEALARLRAQLPDGTPPVGVTFAGFNGENFDAKLWGVAQLRHRDFFAPTMVMEHPADKYGDTGAATGAILLSLAATALRDGSRTGPAFVWAASDHEPRACALLSLID